MLNFHKRHSVFSRILKWHTYEGRFDNVNPVFVAEQESKTSNWALTSSHRLYCVFLYVVKMFNKLLKRTVSSMIVRACVRAFLLMREYLSLHKNLLHKRMLITQEPARHITLSYILNYFYFQKIKYNIFSQKIYYNKR